MDNIPEITKQKAKIAGEKLLIYSGLITLGKGVLSQNESIILGAIILETISIKALISSKKELKTMRKRKNM